MIDLHCHILPGVDDGSPDPDSSCKMAQMAADSGVKTIVATPHCNLPNGPHNYYSDLLLEKMDALNSLIRHYQIPVCILPGSEVLVRDNLPRLLERRQVITLNHSRYLLVEFFFNAQPLYISRSLEYIQTAGLVPVIAHPERYEAVQQKPMLAAQWFRSGAVLQVNKGSILGRLGHGAHKTSIWLLDHGFAHVVASDAHGPHVRTTNMDALFEFLRVQYPEPYVRLLLEENPRRIVQDLPVPIPGSDADFQ